MLVIESDAAVADLLARGLDGTQAHGIDRAADGRTGLSMAESLDYALITLDLMMPELGGPQLCKALREARPDTPLLAITARTDTVEALLGRVTGIDDYVVKPVAARELVRKAEALLARPRGGRPVLDFHAHDRFTAGGILFDAAGRRLQLDGKTITGLSLAELELLFFLAEHEGVSFSEEELLATLWGLHPPARLKHLSVDLNALRRRIRGASGARYLRLAKEGRIRFDERADPW